LMQSEMSGKMIRIVIADDHALIREGLKSLVEPIRDMAVISEACNAEELITALRKKKHDVIVLDISMPGRSGLDVLKDLKRDYPQVPVLVQSLHSEERFALRALRAGASGYLTKDRVPDELVAAIRKVAGGGKYVSVSLAERLALDLQIQAEKPLHESLSDREYQVLRMIASGLAVKEISKQLGLSIHTVNTYRARMLNKMHMKKDAELIRYALEHALID
jgi:two-component system invasion response regulator UvrY